MGWVFRPGFRSKFFKVKTSVRLWDSLNSKPCFCFSLFFHTLPKKAERSRLENGQASIAIAAAQHAAHGAHTCEPPHAEPHVENSNAGRHVHLEMAAWNEPQAEGGVLRFGRRGQSASRSISSLDLSLSKPVHWSGTLREWISQPLHVALCLPKGRAWRFPKRIGALPSTLPAPVAVAAVRCVHVYDVPEKAQLRLHPLRPSPGKSGHIVSAEPHGSWHLHPHRPAAHRTCRDRGKLVDRWAALAQWTAQTPHALARGWPATEQPAGLSQTNIDFTANMFKQPAHQGRPRLPRNMLHGLDDTGCKPWGFWNNSRYILIYTSQLAISTVPGSTINQQRFGNMFGGATTQLYTATGSSTNWELFCRTTSRIIAWHSSSALRCSSGGRGKQLAFRSYEPGPRSKSRIRTWNRNYFSKASRTFRLFSVFASQVFADCFWDFLCFNASLMKGAVASVAYHNNSATSRTASVVSNGGVPERPQRCVAPRDFITSRTRLAQDSDSWNSSSTILQAGFSAAWAHAL